MTIKHRAVVSTTYSILRPTPVFASFRMPLAQKRAISIRRVLVRKRLNNQPPIMFARPRITLTPVEQKVREILIAVAADIDSKKLAPNNKEPLTLRITGGWVRDKLLGEECHDIDVGINKMTGFDFATRLTQFLEENKDQYNIPTKSIHKIESNPEKSKHLETATTKVLGLDIDFVNLRNEQYTDGSRIPQMEFGTPVQDALRRDACVNALFYNIHTQEVEDFTERGIQDMRDKLIRTPLPPFETFDDDPLRVLRLLRFSSRLAFTIVPEAKEAMRNPEIKKALRLKISRERVGMETQKMLYGPNPHLALSQIHELGLFEAIFAPPIESLPILPQTHLKLASNIVHCLLNNKELKIRGSLMKLSHERFLGWLIAALSPWKDQQFPGVDTKKGIPAAATVVREGLKFPAKMTETVSKAYRNYAEIQKFAQDSLKTPNPEDMLRGETGLFLRKLGADWKSQFMCALILEAIPFWEESATEPSLECQQIFKKYSVLILNIFNLGLSDVVNFTPALNGIEIIELMCEERGGPWLGKAMNSLTLWQLDRPLADKKAAEDWVIENKQKLKQLTTMSPLLK